MEKRRFGNTDMNVSVLGLGTAEIGHGVDVATVERLIGSALDAGLTVIDTAECYGDSEELIGKAVSHRRSDYYLFTKCGHASGLDGPDWDPKMLEQSIDRSLKRLQVEYVDLVQLHSCSADVLRQGEVIEVLQRAQQAGKTRYIGYSGDGQNALYAVQTGVFDTLQTSLNIADQEVLDLALPAAKERNMGVIAKRPIANAAWRTGQRPESGYHVPYWERLGELQYPFLDGELDAAISVALRFTLSQPGVHTAIVGTANPNRFAHNARLLEAGPLPADQIEQIRARFKEVSGGVWPGLT